MKEPKVSIIIPVYNAEITIEKCLKSLINQKFIKNYEIIVIEDLSKDKTYKIVKAMSKIYKNIFLYKNNKNLGGTESRNVGIKLSRGSIIAFTDSDCLAKRDWLYEITKPIIKRKELAVQGYSGGEKKRVWQTITQEAYDYYMKSIISNKYANRLDTRNCAVHKDVFNKIGLFNGDLRRSGDAEFGLRMIEKGFKIFYNRTANIYHLHRTNLAEVLKISYTQGFNYPILMRLRKKVVSKNDKLRLFRVIMGFLLLVLLFLFNVKTTIFLISISILYYLIKLFYKPYKLLLPRFVYHFLNSISFFFGFFISVLKLNIKRLQK